MKAMIQARSEVQAALQALQVALVTDEPDEIADALAKAGDGIAHAIGGLDGVFRGFRGDVERQAKRLAVRAAS